MEKISLEVTCKRNRFCNWNSCKGFKLPNFVNVAALLTISGKKIYPGILYFRSSCVFNDG